MSKDSINNQLKWCEQAVKDIKEFEKMIISVANSYDAITKALQNTSVFGEFQNKIEQRQVAFREEMKKLIIQLRQENLAYVNKQSDRLSQELNHLS